MLWTSFQSIPITYDSFVRIVEYVLDHFWDNLDLLTNLSYLYISITVIIVFWIVILWLKVLWCSIISMKINMIILFIKIISWLWWNIIQWSISCHWIWMFVNQNNLISMLLFCSKRTIQSTECIRLDIQFDFMESEKKIKSQFR